MVSFKYLAIPQPESEIGGFALWYDTKDDAIKGFSRFHEYLDAPGYVSRYLDISFEKDHPNSYSLKIIIAADDKIYQTEIPDIEDVYVKRLEISLTNYQYYFIAAGYTDEDGNSQLLPINDFNFFRTQVKIGDCLIEGVKKNRWPHEIFASGKVDLSSE
jgi:hypothetical protein